MLDVAKIFIEKIYDDAYPLLLEKESYILKIIQIFFIQELLGNELLKLLKNIVKKHLLYQNILNNFMVKIMFIEMTNMI